MIEARIEQIKLWAEKIGLDKCDSMVQMVKVIEEVGELAAAMLRKDKQAIAEEYGDVMFAMIVMGQQLGIDPGHSLGATYYKNKNRNGRMVDGVYIKAEDLR